jgi:hypothetical protein
MNANADDGRGCRTTDAEVAREDRDGGSDHTEADRDHEGDRGQDGYFAWEVPERVSQPETLTTW